MSEPKNMHSEPMNVQKTSFRLFSPVLVQWWSSCGLGTAPAAAMAASDTLHSFAVLDQPAGSNAHLNTPTRKITTPVMPNGQPNIMPDMSRVMPKAVTSGQYDGLGMWMPRASPLTSIG